MNDSSGPYDLTLHPEQETTAADGIKTFARIISTKALLTELRAKGASAA